MKIMLLALFIFSAMMAHAAEKPCETIMSLQIKILKGDEANQAVAMNPNLASIRDALKPLVGTEDGISLHLLKIAPSTTSDIPLLDQLLKRAEHEMSRLSAEMTDGMPKLHLLSNTLKLEDYRDFLYDFNGDIAQNVDELAPFF